MKKLNDTDQVEEIEARKTEVNVRPSIEHSYDDAITADSEGQESASTSGV